MNESMNEPVFETVNTGGSANKALKIILGIVVVLFVGAASFAGGLLAGQLLPDLGGVSHSFLPSVASTPSSEQQSATPQELQTLFTPFWEAWNIVHEQYVDQPVDDLKLMQGAIRGMMESLGDKHSSYMDPVDYKQANESLSGEYEGIGAYVDTGGDFLTITSPIPGSPAEAAGLRPGDIIVKIDGEDMAGVDPELARQHVLGPAGTVVHLTIAREGEKNLLEFDVTRDKIVIKSATGKMLENDIAYVQVTTFGENTTPELLAALTDVMAQNPKGLILDLRNNGGGFLQTAVEVTSQFLDKGVVLYEQYGDGKKNTFDVQPGGLATDIPMVVLINEGSASASEIVAGALQDYARATLVGVTSYGKGSVQNWIALSDNQGAVRVTIAKWLTPNERTIHEKGLTPEVWVEMTEDDYKNDLDPQLDAAIQTLLAILAGDPIPTSAPTATPVP
ncbi:MAG: S41 family peptidase [Chloroflexi bacterium]|nr:S41 family peptidase [Chloroflexota bacterium]